VHGRFSSDLRYTARVLPKPVRSSEKFFLPGCGLVSPLDTSCVQKISRCDGCFMSHVLFVGERHALPSPFPPAVGASHVDADPPSPGRRFWGTRPDSRLVPFRAKSVDLYDPHVIGSPPPQSVSSFSESGASIRERTQVVALVNQPAKLRALTVV